MTNFIGIDIGASFIKGGILDLEHLIIRNIIKTDSPGPIFQKKRSKSQFLKFEVEAERYLRISERLIKQLLNKGKVKISGIVLSSQMHGMVLVGQDANPLTPFIGWQDERVLESATSSGKSWLDLYRAKLKDLDSSRTGITLRAGLAGTTLFWLKEKRYLKIDKYAKMLALSDFVAAGLTGGKHVIHLTHACGSGLFDVQNNVWDEDILSALAIPKKYLPEVVATGTPVGFYSYGQKRIPVYVSIGDLQAAVAGSLLGEKQLFINIGTGSQVAFVGSRFKVGDYDIRSYFDNKFLYTVTHNPAGRALNVLISFIRDIGRNYFRINTDLQKIWKRLADRIRHKQTSEGMTARISFFKNNATGFHDGYWQRITEQNLTVENMFYAALVNMVENYWQAYLKFGQNDFKRVVVAGGLARKIALLKKLIKQRFNFPVKLAAVNEETLTGLLVYALVCNGNFISLTKAINYCRRRGTKILSG